MNDKHAQDCGEIKKDLEIAKERRNRLQNEYNDVLAQKNKAEEELQTQIKELEEQKAFWQYYITLFLTLNHLYF